MFLPTHKLIQAKEKAMEIGSLRMDDHEARAHVALRNHITEKEAIERKLNNPNVPTGKKEKLMYRMNIVQSKITQLCTAF